MKKTIVISGINLVDGGTYSIFKECLDAISNSNIPNSYKVIALVHRTSIFPAYANIDLIEFPKSKKNYILRFYYEYIKFQKISKILKPKLWLSLHDMSPIVSSEIQAVYMHNPSPFLGRPKSLSLRGIGFSSLYKYIYRFNIHSNKYLIVQQEWLRNSFSQMFSFSKDKIIVARPVTNSSSPSPVVGNVIQKADEKVFIYASYPRVFKNFEIICEAVSILHSRGIENYTIKLTIDGSENKYAYSLVKKYSQFKNLRFIGLQPYNSMHQLYSESDCLIFPSKAETWGLPISEYMAYKKPMILADLPYAKETSSGANLASFVDVNNPKVLADRILEVINDNYCNFTNVPSISIVEPHSSSWSELFHILLKDDK